MRRSVPVAGWVIALLLSLLVPAGAAAAATPITFVGAGTGFSAGGSTLTASATVPTPPAGSTGALLVVSVAAERGLVPSVSGVSGLTQVRSEADATTLSVATFFKRMAPGDAGATITAEVAVKRRMTVVAAVWTGVQSVGVANAPATYASGTAYPAPPITPTLPGATLVGIVGTHAGVSPWAVTYTHAAPWTRRAQVNSTHPSADNASLVLGDRTALTGGAGSSQPGATFTGSVSGRRFMATTLALYPQTEQQRRESLRLGVDEPGAASTGVLPDVPLTTVNGNVTLNVPGTVYENKDVIGKIRVTAADVTLRNVRVRGPANYTPAGNDFLVSAFDAAVRNLRLEHVTLRPDVPTGRMNGIAGHDYTARFVDCSRVVDCFSVYNTAAARPYRTGTTIEQSYCHDLSWFTGPAAGQTHPAVHPTDTETHNDCIQHQGGLGTVIRGNSLHAGPYAKQVGHWRTTTPGEPYTGVPLRSLPDGGPYVPIPDRGSGSEATGRYNWDDQAVLMIGDEVGPSYELTFTDNWNYGGNYAVNGGGNPVVPGAFMGDFLRNRFDRRQGSQSSGGNTTHTITLGQKWGSKVNAGEGTADQNTYLDGAPITFRGH